MNFKEIVNGVIITLISGVAIGIFNLNTSIIRLTSEIEAVKILREYQINAINERLDSLEQIDPN